MTTSFSRIIELNNSAVEKFEAGNISEAKILFRKLIDELKAHRSHERRPTKTYVKRTCKITPVSLVWSQLPRVEIPQSKNGAFIIARTVMLIHEDLSQSRKYLALALYNLAVTVHIEASIISSSVHFEGACRLYDISMKVMKDEMGSEWCSDSELNLVHLSILNNRGTIFTSELMRYQDGLRCFRGVAKLLATFQTNHDFLDDHVVRELTMNLYVKGQVNVAPAA